VNQIGGERDGKIISMTLLPPSEDYMKKNKIEIT
jgi:hypothetical protein